MLFYDDAKLFILVPSLNDCELLQTTLNNFIIIIHNIIDELAFNNSKCKIMTFIRARDKLLFNYPINGLLLTRVYRVVDLCFIFFPTLSFGSHIDIIVCKAFRMLDSIRKTVSTFNSTSCLNALYNILVQSVIEYGTVIWSLSMLKDKKKMN